LRRGLIGGAALRRLALLALPVAMLGCATPQDEASAPSSRPTLDATLARLPATVAGFERGTIQDVAPNDPGAGKAVEYATPRRVAVAYVFLYDMGRPNVTSADLGPEIERAVTEGTTLPADRTGRRLTERSRGAVEARGGPLSCAVLDGTFGRTAVERHVCVGAAAGRFLRIQVTMPGRGTAPADARAFASEIAAALRAS
jgi:hypothetical protein